MMDPFYAFLLFAVLVILENMAAQRWMPVYFRTGLPVFIRRVPLAGVPDTQAAVALLESAFQSGPHAAVRFQKIAPGQVALRAELFAQRTGPRYLPVLHSLVELRANSVIVRGSLNWYILVALGYAVNRSYFDQTFIPVNILLIVIFVLSYLAQAAILEKVAKVLAGTAKQGE
jgi:hypothetical protein